VFVDKLRKHCPSSPCLVLQIVGYIGDVSTFLHQAYDNALSIRPEQEAVQFKVQIVRTHLQCSAKM